MKASCTDLRSFESGIIITMRDKAAKPSSPQTGRAGAPRSPTVAIVVYDGVSPFELGVACDVFGESSRAVMKDVPWYKLFVCGARPTPVSVNGGFHMQAPYGLERMRRVDSVVIPPTDRLDCGPRRAWRCGWKRRGGARRSQGRRRHGRTAGGISRGVGELLSWHRSIALTGAFYSY